MKIDHKNALYKSIAYGIFFLLVFESILFGFSAYSKQTSINNLYPKSESIQTQIENVFQSTFTISDGYLSYMTSNLDSTREQTETFLGYLLSYEENYINNIAVIEDTTIKFNYPYEENQSSIGVDLATVETQRSDILRVKNNLETLFIGPVDLVQGGRAFILRIPILENDDYWGQIAVVIDVDLFTQTLTNEADTNNVAFKIFDDDSDSIILEYGDTSSGSESITNVYTNKYFDWTITVTDLTDSSSLLLLIMIRVIGYGFIFVLAVFIYKDKALDNKVIFNSTHDSLTGCLNRAKFINDYQEGLFKDKLIAFTDVNKFKLLNDTLGHSFGDWCLIQIANKYRSLGDLRVYRISGDEFMLVSTIEMTLQDFMDKLVSNNFTFYSEEFKQNVDIEIAIGIMEKLNENISLESIFMYLDYAMYDAKEENKSFTVVDQKLMAQYDETKIIEQQIIEDIKQNNLILYYQPMINLDTKKIEGFEVVSRWLYQDQIRTATFFIDVVKKIKYIDLVDRNLFEKLQEEYLELTQALDHIKDLTFSINLSFEILMIFERNNERFDKFVENLNIPKEKLIFEISEDMNLGLISMDTLRYIQNKGYAISIDDFGAGVSKLSDVLSGELKIIKTDKSLLPLEISDNKKLSAFNTIINAINASDTTICVEGIETVEQLDFIIQSGCKLAQGFLFSKPIPKEKVIDYIKQFKYSTYASRKK